MYYNMKRGKMKLRFQTTERGFFLHSNNILYFKIGSWLGDFCINIYFEKNLNVKHMFRIALGIYL